MKIAFVNSITTWGGGEKWHYDSSVLMSGIGHEVYFIGAPKGELHKKLKTHPQISYLSISLKNNSFLNPVKVSRIQKWLSINKVDVVVINHPGDLKIVSIAARRAGVKRIIYRRGSAIPIKNSFLNRIIFGKYVTDILANSQATKLTINANGFLFDEQKIKVIYNPLDIEEFVNRSYKSVIQREENQLTIASVGRLSAEKNHRFLIDLSAALKSKKINHRIFIAGAGKLEAELKMYALEKDTADTVHFMGFLENVKDLLCDIDVFVLPSLWEGFGYVLAEASLCKKPIIAFNTSSIPELVEEGKNGFLVNINSIEEAISKIKLLQNQQLRQQMGEYGFRFASQKFDKKIIYKQLEEYLTHQ